MPCKAIAVAPPDALNQRRRLLKALEAAFDVRFEPREFGAWRDVDAALIFASEEELGSSTEAVPVRCLIAAPGSPRAQGGVVALADDVELDSRLRGRRLFDARAGALTPLPVIGGDNPLATRGNDTLWKRRRVALLPPCDIVSLAPEELGARESLREHLTVGKFVSLLPMVHFLREVTAESMWTPPPLRATWIIDDPNLHWPSYGYLNYPQVASEAKASGYHVAVAMVPLDGWFAHPAATRVFRANPQAVSLVCHGNDHLRHELATARPARDTSALLAQALRRIDTFERRTGVPVARIMVAPHERCAELSARYMLRLGFEALFISRPYPWFDYAPIDAPLAGWSIGDLVAGGLPVVPRYALEHPRDDLVFRAFLDQPLVLVAHHGDFADGLRPLEQGTEDINRLGPVEWASPTRIVRSNFATRREGEVLAVRAYSRRVKVEIPEGVSAVRLETPPLRDAPEWRWLDCAGHRSELLPAQGTWRSEPFSVTPGVIELFLGGGVHELDPYAIPARSARFGTVARRAFTEGRDRVLPTLDRLRPTVR